MSKALQKLLRLRAHHRLEAMLALKEAENEFEAQRARVEAIRASVDRGRAAVDPRRSEELAAYAAWRVQAEMGARREGTRLAQRARDLEVKAGQHRRAVQDELAIENVLAARAEEAALEARRAEAREMDEIASRRRR